MGNQAELELVIKARVDEGMVGLQFLNTKLELVRGTTGAVTDALAKTSRNIDVVGSSSLKATQALNTQAMATN
ncbi:MAG TPA: hypothetical protein VH815_16000, partial [Acidobacteriota bacterium]